MKNDSKQINSTSKLRKVLFTYSAISVFIFTLILSLSIISVVFSYLKESTETKLLHFARLERMTIEEWIRRAKDISRQITSRTRIREELEKYEKDAISIKQLTCFTSPKLYDAMKLSNNIIGIIRANYRDYGFKGRLVKPFQLNDIKRELSRVMDEKGDLTP